MPWDPEYRPFKHLSDEKLANSIKNCKEYLQRYHPPGRNKGNEDARGHNEELKEMEEEQKLRSAARLNTATRKRYNVTLDNR